MHGPWNRCPHGSRLTVDPSSFASKQTQHSLLASSDRSSGVIVMVGMERRLEALAGGGPDVGWCGAKASCKFADAPPIDDNSDWNSEDGSRGGGAVAGRLLEC